MQVITTREALLDHIGEARQGNASLGLVPTMGALHQGHVSLVAQAVAENDITVVSIFVNPTQFNNSEDLEKYPQTLSADVALLEQFGDKAVVFAPSAATMYPKGTTSKSYDFGSLETVMEGAFRPGHFDGVGTIVEAFFRLVEPDKAYFGEKDYQQLLIIKKLVANLQLPITIVGCPIVREPNGLALSSRNQRLTTSTREAAGFIYETMKTAKTQFGTKNAHDIKDWVSESFLKNPTFNLEYVSIADAETLLPLEVREAQKKYRMFVAVQADNVRLIDNMPLN